MNAELAQLVALVAHGNLFLAGKAEATTRELKDWNSAFQYVDELVFSRSQSGQGTRSQVRTSKVRPPIARGLTKIRRFVKAGRGGPLASLRASMQFDGASIPPEDVVARSTSEWLRYLRSCGVLRLAVVPFLRLRDIPGHIAVAFAGGGQFGIETSGKEHVHWLPSWRVKDRAHPQKRIWAVIYNASGQGPSLARAPELPATTQALEKAIRDAAEVAHRADLQSWRDTFEQALEFLKGIDGPIPYHPDMLPDVGYSREARRLLTAASQAWVFGGMGSWNDVLLQDHELNAQYKAVTPALFEAVTRAVLDVANSFS